MPQKSTSRNVFINCPFDSEYVDLFRPLVFTLIYLDFEPLFSNVTSSHQVRIHEIMKLIEKSRFGIHDLSRNKSQKEGEISRFNMPFELGLDMGCRRFGGRKFQHKKILIMDAEAHQYDRFIGDISGQDIGAHGNSPEAMTQIVRDWMARIYHKKRFPGASIIWTAFNQFNDDLPIRLAGKFTAKEILELQMSDYIGYAQDWVSETKTKIERI